MTNEATETEIKKPRPAYHLVAKNVQDVAVKPEDYSVWQFARKRDLEQFILIQKLNPSDIAGIFKGKHLPIAERREIRLV